MISIEKATPVTVNSVHVKVLGESLDGTKYFVNAEGTNSWEEINLEEETEVENKGKKLRFRIEFTSTSTRVSSAVVMYK